MAQTVRILIVDDLPMVRTALRRVLGMETDSYEFFEAADGTAGLAVLQVQAAQGEPIRVVTSDFNMPGMDGMEFLRQVRAQYPDTIRFLVSDVAESVALAVLGEGVAHCYVRKPWDSSALRVSLRTALTKG